MQRLYDNLCWGFRGLLDLVLPPLCIVTGQIVEKQGMLSSEAWQGLRFIMAPQCQICGVPFDYEVDGMAGDALCCASCMAHIPQYDQARSALVYNDASRDMILGFKHADKTHYAQSFVPWLVRAGGERLKAADFLVPVPLHYSRLLKRRYNQAALMAQFLSKEVRVPCLVQGLRRVKATKSQGHMGVKDRAKNVKGVFQADPDRDWRGKHVVLVDDVLTSGATVNECARVLKQAGAVRVDVLTLARVVKDGMIS